MLLFIMAVVFCEIKQNCVLQINLIGGLFFAISIKIYDSKIAANFANFLAFFAFS